MNELLYERIYLYTRFERFWHWAQAGLILFLVLTGLEVHGSLNLFGFGKAADLHNAAAIAWLTLYVFILFWQSTTGQWKHYIPTTRRLLAVVKYYAWGIFHGEPHPVPKTEKAKHNPLQRLTYLAIAVFLIPLQVATGVLYYTYGAWPYWGAGMRLGPLAAIHMAGAFALIAFLVVHTYMVTTGHKLTAHLIAMCTGWEEVPANGTKKQEEAEAA